MTEVKVLQTEIARWEDDLARLEEECTAEGWTAPEKLLFTVQRTVDAYRRQVLPRITADRLLMLPALPDDEAQAALAAYCTIVTNELTELVGKLEELRIELIRFGQTPELQLQSIETLAALRALGKVVVRFGQEVETPGLTD